MGPRGTAPILALLATMIASPALADAIDGHWCTKDGDRRLQIEGPSIVTPGGRRLQGNYDRHHFSYVAPPADMGAGQTVNMILLGELAVQIQIGEAAAEVWNRCGPPLSLWQYGVPGIA
jgi:hypothetical protein